MADRDTNCSNGPPLGEVRDLDVDWFPFGQTWIFLCRVDDGLPAGTTIVVKVDEKTAKAMLPPAAENLYSKESQ